MWVSRRGERGEKEINLIGSQKLSEVWVFHVARSHATYLHASYSWRHIALHSLKIACRFWFRSFSLLTSSSLSSFLPSFLSYYTPLSLFPSFSSLLCLFLRSVHSNTILAPKPRSSKRYLFLGFSDRLHFSSIPPTCPTSLRIYHVISGGDYKLRSFSLCTFLTPTLICFKISDITLCIMFKISSDAWIQGWNILPD